MKRILLPTLAVTAAAGLCTFGSLHAQSAPPAAPTPAPAAAPAAPSPEEIIKVHVKHRLAELTEKLSLTADQQAQIKPVLFHEAKVMEELHKTTKSQIEAVLTPAQTTIFDSMGEHHHTAPAGTPPAQ